MKDEERVYVCNGVLPIMKNKIVICIKMDGIGDYCIEGDKQSSKPKYCMFLAISGICT
jgi:hypothetical protein